MIFLINTVSLRLEPLMDTNEHELFHKEEAFDVVGSAMEVLNELGHGLLEKPYENALAVELKLRNIIVQQQSRYKIVYKGVQVGEYIPDLITHGKLVVDTKVIERITNHEIGQMINYLKITGLKVGLILNFKRPTLEWKRVVY